MQVLHSSNHDTYADACGNIVNTIMTNEHPSSEKYTSHTLFERVAKGLCVRGELETEQTATYWPPVSLSLAELLFRSAGLLNPESWGPIALCWVLVFSTPSYLQLNWLQLTVSFQKSPKILSSSLPGMTSFTSQVLYPIRGFYYDICDCPILPAQSVKTCTQCVPLPVH